MRQSIIHFLWFFKNRSHPISSKSHTQCWFEIAKSWSLFFFFLIFFCRCKAFCHRTGSDLFLFLLFFFVRRGGAEVAGWTLVRKIRILFPAYPHSVWALSWQGGKRRLRTSWYPCRGRLGTLKTPSCTGRLVPGSRSKFGNWTSVRHSIAEISLNVTLNHNQPINYQAYVFSKPR